MKDKKYKVIKQWPLGPSIGVIISPNTHNWIYLPEWIKKNPELAKEYLDEVKQPLFVTEDGIGIWDKSEYYYIDTHDNIIRRTVAYETFRNDYKSDTKRFFTLPAAKKALDNKMKLDTLVSISKEELRRAISEYDKVTTNISTLSKFLKIKFDL